MTTLTNSFCDELVKVAKRPRIPVGVQQDLKKVLATAGSAGITVIVLNSDATAGDAIRRAIGAGVGNYAGGKLGKKIKLKSGGQALAGLLGALALSLALRRREKKPTTKVKR